MVQVLGACSNRAVTTLGPQRTRLLKHKKRTITQSRSTERSSDVLWGKATLKSPHRAETERKNILIHSLSLLPSPAQALHWPNSTGSQKIQEH